MFPRPNKQERMSRTSPLTTVSATSTRFHSIPETIGPILKHYKVLEKVGKGAFSVVYKALEIAPPYRTVALKVVDFNVFQSDKERERQQKTLEGELAILDAIESKIGPHQNFARVYGICRDTEALRIGIAMELLTGGELFDRIVRKRSYSERDAALLMKSVLTGLSDLHSIGIIHCDLKPENLLFADPTEEAPIKITDFGLSKMKGLADVHAGALVGTAQYVCPEALNKREYTTGCDVWSMGVVLYILLCGYPPFGGKNNAETFGYIKKGKFEFHDRYWKNVSQDAKRLVVNMLQVDPSQRFTVNHVLNDPWIKKMTLSTSEPSTLAPEMLENLRRFNGKRKLKAAAMAVMIGARFGMKKRLVEIVERSPVSNFSLDQLTKLRESFKKYATDDSRVTKEGFAKALGELGFSTNIPVDALFRLFDTNKEGSIPYRAFLTHRSTMKDNGEDSIRFCFDVYDENGDGQLSKEELTGVLKNLLMMDPEFTQEDLDEAAKEEAVNNHIEDIFARLDSDGNGMIDFNEFKQGILRDPVLVQSILKPIQDLQ